MTRFHEMLSVAERRRASDLHLHSGLAPRLRIDGSLLELDGEPATDESMVQAILDDVLSARQRSRLESERYLDLGHQDPAGGRWRIQCFYQHEGVSVACRRLAGKIPTLEALGLPATLSRLAHLASGMVIVTGATGSGKSTTLAALLGVINQHYARHIVTIEDPIEYVFTQDRSIFHQREVGTDVPTFAAGAEDALRESPDVLVLGEMRDYETVRLALGAAETGTLVFATLHAGSASAAIHRMIDVAPGEDKPLVRALIAQSLQAVVAQMLLPRAIGRGRVAVCEILLRSAAMASLVREGKIHEIPNCIQTGGAAGMILQDDSLARLVKSGEISKEAARTHAVNPERFSY